MTPVVWKGSFSLENQTQCEVELFSEADLSVIYDIELRTHPTPWKSTHFIDSLKASSHHCIGVRLGQQWLAYAIVSCVADEAELLLLVVDKPWQRRGVAKQLLTHVFQCLNGAAETLFLEVRSSNLRAIDLYDSLEFNQVGIRPGYYPVPGGTEDAMIFARMLT